MDLTITIKYLKDNIEGDKVYSILELNFNMTCVLRNSNNSLEHLSCLYILLGPKCNRRLIYVGQTNNISKRISDHKRNKDWWEETLYFYYDNKQFTKTETEWLEEHVIKLIIDSNYYDVIKNYQIPNNVIVNENDIEELNKTLNLIKLLLYVYGCPIININKIIYESNNTSKSIIDRIVKSYKTIPEDNEYVDEEDGIVHYKDATYFDIGNGRIIICTGSKVFGDIDKYSDKIENNTVIKDIIVDNEDEAKLIIDKYGT